MTWVAEVPNCHADREDVAAVEFRNVSLFFRDTQNSNVASPVLDDISFKVPRGNFVAVVGPTGCGKTTILYLLAGVLTAAKGKVLRDGAEVLGPGKGVGFMPARSGLSPWRTAHKNVELGLEIRKVGRAERRQIAERLLDVVGLSAFSDHYPSQLSQGMRQRVGLARTLAVDPVVLLMDEPFAALDAQTRLVIQAEFGRIWEETRRTVIFVTHDLEEALMLGDRVIVLSKRPARIVADMPVPFARPRNIEDLRFDPQFQEAQHRLWKWLDHA